MRARALAWAVAGALGCVPAGALAPGLTAALTLKVTPGGATVQGRVDVPTSDDLTGVWSSAGRGRLLRCTPRCAVVDHVPVRGRVVLGSDTEYRVALGGRVTPGRKVTLVLRLRGGLVVNVTAPVTR